LHTTVRILIVHLRPTSGMWGLKFPQTSRPLGVWFKVSPERSNILWLWAVSMMFEPQEVASDQRRQQHQRDNESHCNGHQWRLWDDAAVFDALTGVRYTYEQIYS